jgi:hypothetical protein
MPDCQILAAFRTSCYPFFDDVDESSSPLFFDNSFQTDPLPPNRTDCVPRTKPTHRSPKRSQRRSREDGSNKRARSPTKRFPRTKPIRSAHRSPKRSQRRSREDRSNKRARSPTKRFPQTNPLTRYDALSSEKCRCSGREGCSPNEANLARRVVSPNEANSVGAPFPRVKPIRSE